MQLSETINKKWAPVLDHPDLPKISDPYRRAVTAMCLENVESQYAQDQQGSGLLTEATPTTVMGLTSTNPSLGGVAGGSVQVSADFADPVLISMVRRAMPQLVAYDVCGVQPMSGPTGLIFALKSRVNSMTGAEMPGVNADTTTTESGTTGAGDTVKTPGLLITGTDGTGQTGSEYGASSALETDGGEGDIAGEMSFSIEKISIAAGTRALKGSYSMELAQDYVQFMVWMQKQNLLTFCLWKFLQKSTVRLFVRFMSMPQLVPKLVQLLLVFLTLIPILMVVGWLRSSKV